MSTITKREKPPPLFHPYSRRFYFLMLLAIGFCCTTYMRIHLAITMTCMVNSTAIAITEDEIYHPEHSNFTIDVKMDTEKKNATLLDPQCERQADDGHPIVVDYGGTLLWSHRTQNIIFSGTFWGALLVIGPSMLIWHRCSPRLILLIAMVSYVVVTFATPFLALHFGPIAVFSARVIMGFGEGFVVPSFNALISNWFPVEERSTALAVYTTGNQLAGAIGNPLAAALCASPFGWPGVFYSIAIFGSLWCVLWVFTSTDHPRTCKRISQKEHEYLTTNIVHSNNRKSKPSSVPYTRMFTSPPFLAQLLCFYTTNLTMTFYHFYMPSFLKDVLYLGVIANGTFSSLPNVVNLVCKISWGILMDRLKSKKLITPTFAVRISQSVASFGSALAFLMVAMFVDCSTPMLALVLFSFMYGSMGGFSSGFYTSLLSLAPRYTSTMSAISLFVGVIARLSIPPLVGFIKTTGTLTEWYILFCTIAVTNVFAGAVFLLFGSGDVQEWGQDDVKEKEKPVEKVDEVVLVKSRRTDSICVEYE
uniref:MFS domain-containing protein n=1 Tax=Haemonchus contortus TaxID=6289 RepID=A0A7I4YPU6_HAECO